MFRPHRVALAIALIAFGVSLVGPPLAAADAAPWVGTYKGLAVGKDKNGKKGTSGVTIWVQDLGGSTKFTFRFDKLPVVVDQTGRNGGGVNGSMLVRFSVNKAGMNGSGMFVLYPHKGNYMIAAKGAGKAFGKQGTGRLSAVRVSTGVDLPSTVDQFRDMFSTLFGKKVDSTPGGALGGGSSITPPVGPLAILSDETGAVSVSGESGQPTGASQEEIDAIVGQAPSVTFVVAKTVEPASVLDPATAQPPTPTQAVLTAMGLLLVLTLIAAIVGVGPRARPAQAAPVPAQAAPVPAQAAPAPAQESAAYAPPAGYVPPPPPPPPPAAGQATHGEGS